MVLLVTTTVVVTGMYLLMQWAFERGFISLVESQQNRKVDAVIERLAHEYVAQDGWTRLRANRERWIEILLDRNIPGARLPWWARRHRGGRSDHWPPPRRRSHIDNGRHSSNPPERIQATALELRLMLFDTHRELLIGRPSNADRARLEAITVAGNLVGWLGIVPGPALSELADIEFLARQQRTFLIIAAVMILLVGMLALPLAATMTKRLRIITQATRALAHGQYDTKIAATSGDELGELATDVNDLARALARTEHSRRQWVGDISHELRTPLAVQRAELEALQDGVRPLNAAAVDSLIAESKRLERLVHDLYDLAMSDLGTLSYRKHDLDPVKVIDNVLSSCQGEFDNRGITVRLQCKTKLDVQIHADEDRLAQLFRNLFANTFHYTDTGGSLKIEVTPATERVHIKFFDSAPGVAACELTRLFDRFHRVEGSRSRAHGGAGLGLAICRSIVEAHDGHIEAFSSPLGGLGVVIDLPLAP